MTGPEHYREAERILAAQKDDSERVAHLAYAEAQVHATLALAAATALEPSGAMDAEDPDYLAWYAVAGIARPIKATVMTAAVPAVPVAATVACATQRGTTPPYTEPPGITHCPPGHCVCGGATECAGCGNTTFRLPRDGGPPTCAACGEPAGTVTS